MKKNWIIAGLVATVIMVATFGAVIAAEDTGLEAADAGIVDFDETTDGDVNYLITKAQMEEINAEKREMIRAQIIENLETYGLTDAEIMEIDEMLDALEILRIESFETVKELKEQGLTREEIRAEMEPIHNEIQELRTELKDKLAEYDIILPDPPMKKGQGRRGQGFGGPRNGEPGMGGPGFGGPRGDCGNGNNFQEPRP